MKKVIFFGSSEGSLFTLKKLLSSEEVKVVAVVTSPNKPFPLSIFCQQNNIPVLKFPSKTNQSWLFANEEDVYNKIKELQADLLIVLYFGQKIPIKVINLTKYGGINIHFSLLPKYRGAAPVEWAIVRGEKEVGITLLTLAENIDEGKIIFQTKEPINNTDTAEDIYNRCFSKCSELLIKILPDYFAHKIKLISQDNSQASSAPRLKKDDGKIDWNESSGIIERKIRAFSPWPGTFTFVKLDKSSPLKRLKLLKSHIKDDKLIIDQVQLEGKKPVSFEQFKKGYPNSSLKA